MRLIDADALFDEAFKVWGTEADGGETNLFMEMINNAPTITPLPNDPLTMEELRGMDGEPVWTAALDYGASRWAFVSADCEVVRYFSTRRNVACDVIGRHFRTYGKTWLAYRRRPEALGGEAAPALSRPEDGPREGTA